MNMRCGHILLLSFAYCSPVPFALGWFYSDIWAKRKAVIENHNSVDYLGWNARRGATGAGKPAVLGANCVLQAVNMPHTLGSGSGGRRGHIAKLQPHSPQAPATPCLRPLAVPPDWNFHHRFGVPVLACSPIATMDTERATRRT
jgi:hypothetical protein